MDINNVTFPLPKEWLAEFKDDWYKDNNSLPKKRLNDLWAETERVCYMVYKYQRKVFEKNLAALQSSTLPLIECPDIEALIEKFLPSQFDLSSYKPKEILFMKSVWHHGAIVMFHQLKNIAEDNKSVPLIDKEENPNF